jgi:hypothetical protein
MASKKVETRAMSEERLSRLEKAQEEILEKLAKLEKAFSTEISEIKAEIREIKSAREVLSLDIDGRLDDFGRDMQDLRGRVEACVLSHDDINRQWPVVGNSTDDSGLKDKVTNSSPAGKLADRTTQVISEGGQDVRRSTGVARETEGKILVVGDSLARGVGFKMTQLYGDNVEVNAVGGAKVKDVLSSVRSVTPGKTETLVVIAGANNMEEDFSKTIEDGLQEVIDAGKKVAKEVVIVGLVKRYDLGSLFECKRILVNKVVKNKCSDSGVKFLEYEPERSRLHKDGLHLNWRGQYELGRAILSKCRPSFL